jgi:hypothetical protein
VAVLGVAVGVPAGSVRAVELFAPFPTLTLQAGLFTPIGPLLREVRAVDDGDAADGGGDDDAGEAQDGDRPPGRLLQLLHGVGCRGPAPARADPARVRALTVMPAVRSWEPSRGLSCSPTISPWSGAWCVRAGNGLA